MKIYARSYYKKSKSKWVLNSIKDLKKSHKEMLTFGENYVKKSKLHISWKKPIDKNDVILKIY